MDSPDEDIESAMGNVHLGDSGTGPVSSDTIYANDEEEDDLDHTPIRPSAKALGKRRLVESAVSGSAYRIPFFCFVTSLTDPPFRFRSEHVSRR